MNLLKIKSNIILITFVILISLFKTKDVQAQTDPNLNSLSFRFDTIQSNSPLYISGVLVNISEIKGMSFALSQTLNGASILNDTILFVGSHDSFYCLWNDVISPMKGNTISMEIPIPINLNTGMYYCTTRILYKNGNVSSSKSLYIKK